ncbi:Aldo-keto reductase family 4 member C10 [Chlorella vulgaris]
MAAPQPWWNKYEVQADPRNPQSSTAVKLFSLAGRNDADLAVDAAAVAAAEQRELAARPEATAAAQRALYARVQVPSFTLRDGHTIPAVGLGTWKAAPGEVHTALQAGYRHIDCASVYQNEEEVGGAVHHVLSAGLVPRSELYLCGKVWNNDHAPARVRQACLKSIQALRCEYLDLYLIHWPVTGSVGPELRPSVRETWQAMEGLVREGLVRSIGVSNFGARKLQDILGYAEIPPAVCQVEVHPYHRNDALIAFCRAASIHVTAFSPLGSPDSASIFPRKKPLVLMEDETVRAVAKRTGKNVGQVLIRGNLDVLDWELSAADYAALSTLPFQQRMVNGAMWLNPKGPYTSMEELWDEPELD